MHAQHFQHYLFRFALKGNYAVPLEAPVEAPANILDVGTGTGRWVLGDGDGRSNVSNWMGMASRHRAASALAGHQISSMSRGYGFSPSMRKGGCAR
jgi:hypothetical protein